MGRRNPLDDLDPAITAVLGEAARKQRIRQLPKSEQVKARRDAARQRTIYEIPAALKREVEKIAMQEGLSPSSVVILLLADGVRRYQADHVSFHNLKIASRSPRYAYVIDMRAVLAGFADEGESGAKVRR